MRRFLSFTFILLIAMRGFIGDAMAIEMSRMHGEGDVKTHQMTAVTMDSSAHPCHQAESASVFESTDQMNSSNCTSCQVCHSPALQSAAPKAASFALPQECSSILVSTWASADLVQAQKPPVL